LKKNNVETTHLVVFLIKKSITVCHRSRPVHSYLKLDMRQALGPLARVVGFAVCIASGCAIDEVSSEVTTQQLLETDRVNGTVGWTTYERLDLLPYLSTGARTQMFSSFDRSGGNFDSVGTTTDGVLRRDGTNVVLAERLGPGEIERIWFTADNLTFSHMGNFVSNSTALWCSIDRSWRSSMEQAALRSRIPWSPRPAKAQVPHTSRYR
jgi:hypothetical protein